MNALFVSPLFMTLSAQITRKMGAATILNSDPYGFTVALISIGVVLTALITLAIIIAIFSRIVMAMSKQTAAEAAPTSSSMASGDAASVSVDAGANGEVVAAIALAMKLYQEDLHDHESEIITINTVARAYSPWNSKFHGLTNMPR